MQLRKVQKVLWTNVFQVEYKLRANQKWPEKVCIDASAVRTVRLFACKEFVVLAGTWAEAQTKYIKVVAKGRAVLLKQWFYVILNILIYVQIQRPKNRKKKIVLYRFGH